MNNISDHSAQNTGFIHVQHYPNLKKIKITVSDFGRGIPTTIRERFGDMGDGAAILLASRDGVTAKTRPTNMGAGLSYLIDTVTFNGGIVRIRSLSGSLNCFRHRQDQKREAAVRHAAYPGTLVEIELDTRLFVGDEEERGDLEW